MFHQSHRGSGGETLILWRSLPRGSDGMKSARRLHSSNHQASVAYHIISQPQGPPLPLSHNECVCVTLPVWLSLCRCSAGSWRWIRRRGETGWVILRRELEKEKKNTWEIKRARRESPSWIIYVSLCFPDALLHSVVCDFFCFRDKSNISIQQIH